MKIQFQMQKELEMVDQMVQASSIMKITPAEIIRTERELEDFFNLKDIYTQQNRKQNRRDIELHVKQLRDEVNWKKKRENPNHQLLIEKVDKFNWLASPVTF